MLLRGLALHFFACGIEDDQRFQTWALHLMVQVQNSQFHLGDMLMADMSNAAILLLCSQCWDEDLQDAAVEKILREQKPPHSVHTLQ